MTDSPAISHAFARLRWWVLVIAAVAPFQLLLVWHLSTGPTATGFVDYDSPYYVANGREIFERGNGFAHPNPYDPDPVAPAIYFHWLTWLLGFGVKVLHADPGALLAGIGVVASVVGSALTLRLVETVLPSRRGLAPLFLLTMWGGGLLGLGAVAYNVITGRPPLEDLFVFENVGGWWFSNWGRNFVTSTEAVYHSLVAAAWLAVLQQRWGRAMWAVGLLGATHPFSGLQHLLILGAWLGWQAARERTPAAWNRAGLVLAMAVGFLAYYFWFLNSFAAHRALVRNWSNVWNVPLATLLLASGPVALLATWRLRRQGWRPGNAERFFLVAFAVTLLLMKHDWFMTAHQPAHFSRGYNWLPLWLVALPLLQTGIEKLAAFRPRWQGAVGSLLAASLITFDNAVFLRNEFQRGEIDRHHLSLDQREMFAWMDDHQLEGVLLISEPRLSYLAATYTSARPYYGHFANTPELHSRWRNVAAWHARGLPGEWLRDIDYMLVDRTNPPNFDWNTWRELHRNHDYFLLGR